MGGGSDSSGKILVIEDDPLIALSLAEAFLAAGANEVLILARAEEAVVAMADCRPILLVMDLSLPDSDSGWGLAEIALQLFNPPPKLIFSTGSPERVPEHLACKGTIFAKPYDADELARHGLSMVGALANG